jgi:hypothetical protein
VPTEIANVKSFLYLSVTIRHTFADLCTAISNQIDSLERCRQSFSMGCSISTCKFSLDSFSSLTLAAS